MDMVGYAPKLNMVQKLTTVELKSFELIGMRWVSNLEESKFSFRVRPDFSLVIKNF
jgi:hypothetical protein